MNDQSKIIFIGWGLIEDFNFLNNKTGLFQKFALVDKGQMNINVLKVCGNNLSLRHFSDANSNGTLENMPKK